MSRIHLFIVLVMTVITFILGFYMSMVIDPKLDVPLEFTQKSCNTFRNSSQIVSWESRGRRTNDTQPKKIFLDCGANMASSIMMFREMYPNSREFEIHSFEIDYKLRPYFAAYVSQGNVYAHIPVGVSNVDGNMTAFLEGAWFPGKINNDQDMQWGGGSLFAFDDEKNIDTDGGRRKLSRHVTVPTIDISQWIQKNTQKADYVILKLDVEGAEYEILKKMLNDGTFAWIDKYYGEFHPWQPTGLSRLEKNIIVEKTNKHKRIITWAGESKTISDLDELQKSYIPIGTPGSLGRINDHCNKASQLSIVIEVGMDPKNAKLLVDALTAYEISFPLTLFLYGNFIELYPELVLEWSKHSELGIRGSSSMPSGLWERQNGDILQLSVVSSETRLRELGFIGAYFLPPGFNANIISITKQRHLRLINSTITFPPRTDGYLTFESYFKYRDVERIPKALKILHDGLGGKGGILSLDSDFPDSYLISAFLLDYIFEISSFDVVSLRHCLG